MVGQRSRTAAEWDVHFSLRWEITCAFLIWRYAKASVVLRPTPAFSVFTSSIIDQGGRSLGSHPVTGAMVPPKFHPRFLLHARPSFRQLPWGRGLGSVRSFSGTKTSLTIRLELHCPGEGFFWPSLSLNWTSTRNEDSVATTSMTFVYRKTSSTRLVFPS